MTGLGGWEGERSCHSIKDEKYQTTGLAVRVSRGSLPIQSGDFVSRSPKPAGISELFGQTRQRYGLRRRVLRSHRFPLDDSIRLIRMAVGRASSRAEDE